MSAIAAAVREAPADAMVDAVMASELGDFARLLPIRRLIAQEFEVAKLRPFVETPDLLENEGELVERWQRERPGIAAAALDGAKSALASFDLSPTAGPEHRERVLLRMAACRRIDSWLTGQDRLADRPHALAGDLYWLVQIPGYARPMKLGLCRESYYNTDARLEQELRALFKSETIIKLVEFNLYPLAGKAGLVDAVHWVSVRRRWRDVAPLRALEANTRRGAFPQGIFFQHYPKDIVPRIDPAFIESVGQVSFVQLGLCPWWPRATEEFFAAKVDINPREADDSLVRSWLATVLLKRRPIHCR